MKLSTVTEEEMTKAMKKTLMKKGYTEEEVKEMVDKVMGFFGFDDSIIDNKLTARDRDLFYLLEGEGLLTTASDETLIKKGKIWRIHYWILNKKRINSLLVDEVKKKKSEKKDVYSTITDEQWSQHSDHEQ